MPAHSETGSLFVDGKKVAEKKNRWTKFFFYFFICCILFFLVIVMLFHFLQNKIVFPGQWTQGKLGVEAINCPQVPNDRLVTLTLPSGIHTVMRIKKPEQTNATDEPGKYQAILLFYGNGACLARMYQLLDSFAKMGLIAAAVEYPGYGAAEGRPSEQGTSDAAQAAWRYLVEEEGFAPARLIAFGHSLGAAVACDVAAKREVGLLVMSSGFTTLADAGKYHYPFLPVRWLLQSQFDSASKIPQVKASILFLHGTGDRVVPYEMGQKNLEIAKKSGLTAELVTLTGAGHNLFKEHGEEIMAILAEKFSGGP